MGGSRGIYRFWWGNLRERDDFEDPNIEGRIILRWLFRKLYWGHAMIWLRIWTGGGGKIESQITRY